MPTHSPLPANPINSLTSLISNIVILRCQRGSQWLHLPLGNYWEGLKPRGEDRHLSHHLLSISHPSFCLQLVSGVPVAPLPSRTSMAENQSSCQREVSSRRPFLPQPWRKDGYTSFLASKKLLRCRICHTPMATRMRVCRMDHHSTLWLVLSLV